MFFSGIGYFLDILICKISLISQFKLMMNLFMMMNPGENE
jgi:hypothetical protein